MTRKILITVEAEPSNFGDAPFIKGSAIVMQKALAEGRISDVATEIFRLKSDNPNRVCPYVQIFDLQEYEDSKI